MAEAGFIPIEEFDGDDDGPHDDRAEDGQGRYVFVRAPGEAALSPQRDSNASFAEEPQLPTPSTAPLVIPQPSPPVCEGGPQGPPLDPNAAEIPPDVLHPWLKVLCRIVKHREDKVRNSQTLNVFTYKDTFRHNDEVLGDSVVRAFARIQFFFDPTLEARALRECLPERVVSPSALKAGVNAIMTWRLAYQKQVIDFIEQGIRDLIKATQGHLDSFDGRRRGSLFAKFWDIGPFQMANQMLKKLNGCIDLEVIYQPDRRPQWSTFIRSIFLRTCELVYSHIISKFPNIPESPTAEKSKTQRNGRIAARKTVYKLFRLVPASYHRPLLLKIDDLPVVPLWLSGAQRHEATQDETELHEDEVFHEDDVLDEE